MMHGFNGMGFGMGWAWITGFVILGVIIWIVVKAANQKSPSGPTDTQSALDILKERYARSEISREEFEAKKKDIS
jgi:putative membrane protein